uniref:AAA domain-containing protein n=1 Tax=Candidatus Accumulibacter sp. ACC012 TaxID=2823332 RepID=UPI0025C21C3C
VLVGDHRQLPHLLEPEVESEVVETHGLSIDQRSAFSESLFERLWRQLKDREAADGFPRVVMLDTQFRMHPVLGEFVSKEFYEKEKLAPLNRLGLLANSWKKSGLRGQGLCLARCALGRWC